MANFSHCKGAAAVNHTRMRLGLSHLRQQLHTHHIVETPYCLHSCCHQQPESTDHYLLQCPKYAASRELLLRGLGPTVDRLGINTSSDLINLLLNGHRQPRWLSGLRRSRVHSLVIARRSLCPEKLGSNPGKGSKGINFSGWHGLDMSITVTKRR